MESASLQEVADTIFETGVSTAESISDISGRGIGMEAVRTFLENEGGGVAIVVGTEKEEIGFYNFSILIWVPLGTVNAQLAS